VLKHLQRCLWYRHLTLSSTQMLRCVAIEAEGKPTEPNHVCHRPAVANATPLAPEAKPVAAKEMTAMAIAVPTKPTKPADSISSLKRLPEELLLFTVTGGRQGTLTMDEQMEMAMKVTGQGPWSEESIGNSEKWGGTFLEKAANVACRTGEGVFCQAEEQVARCQDDCKLSWGQAACPKDDNVASRADVSPQCAAAVRKTKQARQQVLKPAGALELDNETEKQDRQTNSSGPQCEFCEHDIRISCAFAASAPQRAVPWHATRYARALEYLNRCDPHFRELAEKAGLDAGAIRARSSKCVLLSDSQ